MSASVGTGGEEEGGEEGEEGAEQGVEESEKEGGEGVPMYFKFQVKHCLIHHLAS